jgi:hypothetical protein
MTFSAFSCSSYSIGGWTVFCFFYILNLHNVHWYNYKYILGVDKYVTKVGG